MRALGLLKQLAARFEIELILLTRQPLSAEQEQVLGELCCRVTRLPLRGASRVDQLRLLCRSLTRLRPYHCTAIESSFDEYPDLLDRIHSFPGLVYASYAHWGTLVHRKAAPNWILDQQHAPADFWRVYAKQAPNLLLTGVAHVNQALASHHFRHVYPGLGRAVCVCEEDKALTLALSRSTIVEVIENGVDCSFYEPSTASGDERTLLFVGTEEHRNMEALRRFVGSILPLVQRRISGVRLLVAGDIGQDAQKPFKHQRGVSFTGPVTDLRESFGGSTVFVVPHEDTHGSQLKVAVAMAMGMPIVSTPKGIRGLPLANGESVLIADDNEHFAGQVCRLLDDRALRGALGASARAAAVTRLDWPVLNRRLVALVDTVAAECSRGPVRRGAGHAPEPGTAELVI